MLRKAGPGEGYYAPGLGILPERGLPVNDVFSSAGSQSANPRPADPRRRAPAR
ncbi:MAG TPA: hypothetical protein VJ436_00765 [Anaerolineales bacterium]|nr:hypothetical protein [Anaerolineales bacterium]